MSFPFSRITTICTGNICRSPMAEAILQRHLQPLGATVDSAGIAALVGNPADPFAQAVMREHGHDVSAHRARQADGALLSRADLILTAESLHNDWVNRHFPALRGRVHKLGRWLDDRDIADPYQHPHEAFEATFGEIEVAIDAWLRKLT